MVELRRDQQALPGRGGLGGCFLGGSVPAARAGARAPGPPGPRRRIGRGRGRPARVERVERPNSSTVDRAVRWPSWTAPEPIRIVVVAATSAPDDGGARFRPRPGSGGARRTSTSVAEPLRPLREVDAVAQGLGGVGAGLIGTRSRTARGMVPCRLRFAATGEQEVRGGRGRRRVGDLASQHREDSDWNSSSESRCCRREPAGVRVQVQDAVAELFVVGADLLDDLLRAADQGRAAVDGVLAVGEDAAGRACPWSAGSPRRPAGTPPARPGTAGAK